MTKETKKQVSPINNANSNVNLKTHLTLALKNTSSIMKVLLPKIAVSVKDLIIEYKKLTEKNTDTDEKNNQIQMKALREHCYSLVGYNRKTDPNSAFEMVCTRAVKLGLMMIDHPNKFDVDAKNSQNGDTEILSGGGIDLIAGNKTEGLQPIPKGDDLSKALIELANLIDKLAGVVHDGFLYQMKYNLKTKSQEPLMKLKSFFKKNTKQ